MLRDAFTQPYLCVDGLAELVHRQFTLRRGE